MGLLISFDAPDEETAVLVIIDDMNLIARGTEPRIVLQNAVPLGIRDSHADVALRDVALEGIQVLAAQTAELIETHYRLTGTHLQEILVLVVARRIVGEILAQMGRQKMVEKTWS